MCIGSLRARIKWCPVYPHSYTTAASWNTLGEAKAASQPQSLKFRLPQPCNSVEVLLMPAVTQKLVLEEASQDIKSTVLSNVHNQTTHVEHWHIPQDTHCPH